MTDKSAPDRPDTNGSVTRAIREYRRYARNNRREGHLETAGTYYVAAARGSFMQFRPIPDGTTDPDADPTPRNSIKFGFGVSGLLIGALCYRLAGKHRRCRRHCEQGESIVNDVLDEGLYTSDARIGLFHELCGDFRLIGNLGDHDDPYVAAAKRYEKVKNILGWSMEGGFEDAIQIPLELAESVGMGVDDDRKNELTYLSLEERIDFKRETYPEIIDAVVDAGNWESDLL